jgi:hypothetical protein
MHLIQLNPIVGFSLAKGCRLSIRAMMWIAFSSFTSGGLHGQHD